VTQVVLKHNLILDLHVCVVEIFSESIFSCLRYKNGLLIAYIPFPEDLYYIRSLYGMYRDKILGADSNGYDSFNARNVCT
jgi:hypothetical protein